MSAIVSITDGIADILLCHDPIIADHRALPDLFLLARRPPHPSSHSSSRFADHCARKHPVHPPVHSFAPTCSSFQRRKNSSRPVPTSLRQHRWHAQISIAVLPHRPPAAPKAHYLLTRFRALALFRHRLVERVGRSVLPASESLAQEETPGAANE